MIGQTLSIIGRNWYFYIVVAAAVVAVSILEELSNGTGPHGALAFVWIYLSMMVQAAVIHSRNFAARQEEGYLKRLLAYVAKTVVLLSVALVIVLPAVFWTMSRPAAPGNPLPEWILLLALILVVAYAAVFALLGTWPTSSITGNATSFIDAAKRGAARFFPTFLRLLGGIILPHLLMLAVLVIGTNFSPSGYLLPDGVPNVMLMLVYALGGFLQAVSITYVAIVIARVYLEAEKGHA
jgi:hypothetical protein